MRQSGFFSEQTARKRKGGKPVTLEKCQLVAVCGTHWIPVWVNRVKQHLGQGQGHMNTDWIVDDIRESLNYFRHNNGIVVLF